MYTRFNIIYIFGTMVSLLKMYPKAMFQNGKNKDLIFKYSSLYTTT